jgi:class 3 adenylate cyclase
MMPERANRTFICSVLFLDITEYSRKPVSEQIQLKDQFNTLIAEAIRDIATNDRIILDTGDGVAINFLGDPEDALFVAMSLRDAFAPRPGEPPKLPARIGINLGPVRLVRDLNGQPNIIGDGINVAQRVMGFAKPGQVLVSRSYFEVVSHISEGYAKLFHYEGSRTDKHVREHEIYSVGYTQNRTGAVRSPAERAQVSSHEGRRQATTAGIATGTSRWLRGVENWLNNRTIAYGTATLSLGAFALAVMLNFLGHSDLPAAQERPAGPVAQKKIPLPEKAAAATSVTGNPRPDKKHATAKAPAAEPVDNNAESVARTREQPVEEKKESKAGPFSFLAKHEEPAAEPAPPPSVGTAIITLAVAPWGEVFVDGDRVGVSPPVNEIEVAPGKRIVEIRNSNFPVFSQVVEVKADQKVRIKHKFN